MHQKSRRFRQTCIRVKVCGITSLEDALTLESLGVHYLGFNFFPGSKRYISPLTAAAIIRKLQTAIPVAIFVNENAEQVNTSLNLSGAVIAQLHGDESPETIARVNRPVIKAIGVSLGLDTLPAVPASADYVLFDTRTDVSFGGTGQVFNWSLLGEYSGGPPIFLAGGIGPENLAKALEQCRPYAVDLNSRVESEPGKKDMALVEKCLDIIDRF